MSNFAADSDDERRASRNAKAAEAVAAIEAGDYATALRKLRAAAALLHAHPDIRDGDQELKYDRRGLEAMIRDTQQAAGSTAGTSSGGKRTIGQIKVTYKSTGD